MGTIIVPAGRYECRQGKSVCAAVVHRDTHAQTKLTHCLTVSLRATVAGRGRLSQVAASNAISRCPQRAN